MFGTIAVWKAQFVDEQRFQFGELIVLLSDRFLFSSYSFIQQCFGILGISQSSNINNSENIIATECVILAERRFFRVLQTLRTSMLVTGSSKWHDAPEFLCPKMIS